MKVCILLKVFSSNFQSAFPFNILRIFLFTKITVFPFNLPLIIYSEQTSECFNFQHSCYYLVLMLTHWLLGTFRMCGSTKELIGTKHSFSEEAYYFSLNLKTSSEIRRADMLLFSQSQSMCTLLLYLPEGYQKFVIIKLEQNHKITFNLQILWDSMCWRVIYITVI